MSPNDTVTIQRLRLFSPEKSSKEELASGENTPCLLTLSTTSRKPSKWWKPS
ncbi:UNVERIFIED_CONTAM: hypothetical protein GTU68_021979 [Idotea baltica]|nr:hypothetical protein [Idotea baltica]